MKTVIQPQPQLWRGHSPWSQEYWLFCNRLYNSLELADMLRNRRRCATYTGKTVHTGLPDGKRSAGWRQRKPGRVGRKEGEAFIRAQHLQTRERCFQTSVWEAGPSDILRVADGDTDRGHRVKAAGNGQVPIVVATAWHTLSRELVR